MSRVARLSMLGAATGALFGLAGGVRWCIVMAAAGGPASSVVLSLQSHRLLCGLALAVSGALLVRLAGSLSSGAAERGVLALALGVFGWVSASRLAAAVALALPQSWVWAVVCGLVILVAGCGTRKPAGCLAGLLLAVGLVPWSHSLSLVAGDDLAVHALAYGPPFWLSYCLTLWASTLSLGLFVGAAHGLIARPQPVRSALLGAGAGALLGFSIWIAQTVTLVVAMRSGQDPSVILICMTVVCASIGLAAALAIHGWTSVDAPRLIRWAPVAVLLIIGAYVYGGVYGYYDYTALSGLHQDGTYTYIHFRADGSWRRTMDQSSCSNRTLRAQEFVVRYPNSAYRAAAMLCAAQSEFEEWRFEEAASTLQQSSREYPLLDGYRDILWAFADGAIGRPGTLLRTTLAESYLAKWRQTLGAQIAADAAARLGLQRRAYGLHSAYVDYLATRTPSSWRGESAHFSQSSMDALAADSGRQCLRRGTVVIRVLGPSGPVHGARVALVQPHPNAALPADSTQFTGAWTIPAWNGVLGVTNASGAATIPGVLYGAYEVVIGLGPTAWPAGTVAQQGPRGVVVQQAFTRCEPVRLVPAVRLIAPAGGAAVSPSVTLRWRFYPGVHHYAVTVMRLTPAVTAATPSTLAHGTTCWARSGIRGESTTIDSDHFVGTHAELKDGRSYMWAVYAYSSDGKLLSSSEHYFDLSEPTFSVRVPGARKGGLPQ